MRRRLMSLGLVAFLGLGTAAFAQVTGVVNDANGFPESDAEVIVKGTGKVAITDENGNFDIDAKVGDVLVINGKEFKVTSNKLGVLKFQDEVNLDEVVIRSIFDAPQKAGQTVVKADAIKDFTPGQSIDQMLGGKVSGLISQAQNGAPGSTANLTIRGALGLNGGVKSPLYVVDGSYMSSDDVNSINPNSIEDIKVLKEASQLAIYGARGANGVIIIKTRGAKRGESRISYSGRIGFTSMMDLPNIKLMNSAQLLDFQNGLVPYGLGQFRTPEEVERLKKLDHSWADDAYRNGIVTSHYFSINKNDGESSQSFSLGYDKDNGAVNFYKGFERITSSFNLAANLNEKFRYGANVNGSYQTLDSPRDRFNAQSVFNAVLENTPFSTVYEYDDNGNIKYDSYGDPIYNVNNGSGYPTFDEMNKTKAEVRQFKLFGSGYLELDLFKNVTARTTFGGTYIRMQQESFSKSNGYLNVLLGTPASKTDFSRDRLAYNWRNEVSYVNSWDKHNLRATAASEYVNENNYQMQLRGQGFPNNSQTVQILAQQILQGGASYTDRWEKSRFGYIGALSYDYDRKYYVDTYIRRDGTSLAGLDNQYGTFWGVSLGWDIARENFLKGNSNINSLVLRASYGEVGDDSGLSVYSNLTTLSLTGLYNGQGIASTKNSFATPSTGWENNKKLNLGLEFGFLGNKLTGSAAFFQDTRTDFLFTKPYSPTMGSYSSTINAGELVTSGLEFDVNYQVVRKKNFDLALYGNITKIKYKVNDLNGEETMFVSGTASNDLQHVLNGSPYQFFMVRYAGVNSQTGAYQYYDKNGEITEEYSSDDAVALGKTPLPTLFGGFGLNTKIYGFDINADFTFSAGGYSYNNVYNWLTDPNGLTNKDVTAADYWKNPGDVTKFGKPDAVGQRESTLYLEKSDYILFRSLSVGYTFDDLIKNTFVKSIRLYGQIQNLAIFTNYNGNPIQGTGSSESSAVGSAGYVSNSFSGFGYPMTRTYSLGFNVTF